MGGCARRNRKWSCITASRTSGRTARRRDARPWRTWPTILARSSVSSWSAMRRAPIATRPGIPPSFSTMLTSTWENPLQKVPIQQQLLKNQRYQRPHQMKQLQPLNQQQNRLQWHRTQQQQWLQTQQQQWNQIQQQWNLTQQQKWNPTPQQQWNPTPQQR